MRHAIVFAPEAIDDLRRLRASDRTTVKDTIEQHLRYEPERTSKSRIKRLRDLRHPQYRLRVDDDLRVFYDVTDGRVEILAVILKPETVAWLEQKGIK
jgi:mRNA-degrading endonuclease RelE of RelBE toxin-antitoxin system